MQNFTLESIFDHWTSKVAQGALMGIAVASGDMTYTLTAAAWGAATLSRQSGKLFNYMIGFAPAALIATLVL